ncbi:M23 family metallopeptidase [Aquincola sp. S2]|uniref:M23 family metallopeptidase n=1 Tax=Pseudaquabacterium terrae TaxID=2732868 RepID=A0ABX2EHR4_9BURK|nr:M23 family metallopeptidase [Aquabacterium terrae]NRF68153.1 M23 family metallopeptidase [Aquabacterium terrae]
MIISPPFLLPRNANETDDQWLERCMPGGQPGDGAFPLSFNLGWHGGMHLSAPGDGTTHEPVRAIADGTVVYRRLPTPLPPGPLPEGHPLAYGGGWTDDGVVVIRHDTEIGEGANASVRYFSIYMHLREIDARVSDAAGRNAIYRKDVIGQAGQISGGTDPQIHFEIVCDDDNLRKLVGRAAGDLPTAADGRTDAVYGEMYFLLPAGTPVFADRPLPQFAQAMVQPPTPAGQPQPAPQPLQPAHISTEVLIIGMRHAGGSRLGAGGGLGDAWFTTQRLDGSTIGAALQERDAEYGLYSSAMAIRDAYPANGRPAPSAVVEMLRFGRVMGPDALNPADLPHWRQVRHDGGGVGWVNLNAPGIRKFSDADFPHWKRWTLVDDSADRDSRCDSTTVRGWLDASGDGQVDPAEAMSRLSDVDVAPRLARTICKTATEWNAATVEPRWGWLRTRTVENPQPLSDEEFAALRAHIGALAFWPGGMGLPEAHWHFQPREFVRWFRRCGWMSVNEQLQLIPVNIIRQSGANHHWEQPALGPARTTMATYGVELNKALRKFVIEGPQRRAAFFGNATQETRWWADMRESGGATPNLHNGWYGRGFLQLTNPNGNLNNGNNNYYRYFKFRGRVPAIPAGPQELAWRDQVATNAHDAAHSAAAYWIWPSGPKSSSNEYADANAVNERRAVQIGGTTRVWYFNAGFRRAAASVNLPAAIQNPNLGFNGFVDRSTAFVNALMVLDDRPAFQTAAGGVTYDPEGYVRRRP